jgi:hypothetical protein
MRDDRFITEEAARWAVESWALALGVVSKAELSERAGSGRSIKQDSHRNEPGVDVEPIPNNGDTWPKSGLTKYEPRPITDAFEDGSERKDPRPRDEHEGQVP